MIPRKLAVLIRYWTMPMPLTQAQQSVVRSARTAPLTVVTGPPGTGKSYTITAIVLDSLLRGESVLVPLPDVTVRAGDQLILEDTPTQLKEYEQVLGATLFSGESAVDEEHPLEAKDQQRRRSWWCRVRRWSIAR